MRAVFLEVALPAKELMPSNSMANVVETTTTIMFIHWHVYTYVWIRIMSWNLMFSRGQCESLLNSLELPLSFNTGKFIFAVLCIGMPLLCEGQISLLDFVL